MNKRQSEMLNLLRKLFDAKSEAMHLELDEVVYMIQMPIISLYSTYKNIDEIHDISDIEIELLAKKQLGSDKDVEFI